MCSLDDIHYIIEPGKPGIPMQFIVVHKYSVGQYTGINSKEDKLICENDIVYCELETEFGSMKKGYAFVQFCPHAHGWTLTIPLPEGKHQCWRLDQDCKVVGNIHQNYELLTK